MRELQRYEGATLGQFQRDEAWLEGLQKKHHSEKRDAVTRLCSIRSLRSTPLFDYVTDPGLLTELEAGFPHATSVDLRYLIGALNRVFWFARIRAKAMAGNGGIKIINGRIPSLRTPPAWVRGKVIALAATGCRNTEIRARLWVSEAYVNDCLGVDDEPEAVASPAEVTPPSDGFDQASGDWIEAAGRPRQLHLMPDNEPVAWDLSSILQSITQLAARARVLIEETSHER